MPEKVTESFINDTFKLKTYDKNKMLLGIAYSDTSPIYVNFDDIKIAGICGSDKLGRFDYVKGMVKRLLSMKNTDSDMVYIIDESDGRLKAFADNSNVKMYINSDDKIRYVFEDILKEKNDKKITLIIEMEKAISIIEKTKDLFDAFLSILNMYDNGDLLIYFTNAENSKPAQMADRKLPIMIRDGGSFIIFEDISNINVLSLQTSVVRTYTGKSKYSDTYYIGGSSFTRMKTLID